VLVRCPVWVSLSGSGIGGCSLLRALLFLLPSGLFPPGAGPQFNFNSANNGASSFGGK
jgi:hypothetical protein